MSSVRYSIFSMVIATITASMLVGCMGRAASAGPGTAVPSVLVPIDQGGITDGRGRFREIFQSVLASQSQTQAKVVQDDTTVLWKLPGEPPATGKPVPAGPSNGNFRVVMVPGLLAECVADQTTAFGDSRSNLEAIGYKTDYIQTKGRRKSDTNADLIHAAAMRMPADERLIFVTHSKGTVDTLESLVKYPDLAERTAAVVSVSGAVNGSPLADTLPEFFIKLGHQFPLSTCEQGEGVEAVDSLRRSVRIAWLATHPLPKNVRYYSIAAFTTRENTSRLLQPYYDILAVTDPINDSMVICSDAIIPGSVLLGYPNADHFAVAMPPSKDNSLLLAALVNKGDYPRAALLEASVRFVEEDLGGKGIDRPKM